MQTKYALPIVGLSLIAAIGFTVQWTQEQQQVHRLVIATGSREGEYYAFAQALANVVAHRQPDIQIEVLATEGATQNLELLEAGKAQLAIVQSDTPAIPSERAVAYLFPEIFHLLARQTSGIQSVADLRGKRIAIMPKGSGSYALFWSLCAHYGMTASDFTAIPLPPDQAYEQLRQGKVDALFRVMALGNPSVAELLRTSRSQLVSIDQVDALRLSRPYLEGAVIPKGTYDGRIPNPPQNLSVVSVRAMLVSHEQVDASVIRDITQMLFEFRNEIVAQYPRAASIRLPESGENLGLPLHPGAKAYYIQDQPNFWVVYSEQIGLLLSVGVLCLSGLWQLRLWLAGRQKNRADMYNLEILALIDRLQTATHLHQLEAERSHLFDIFRKVVIDLDQDRITPESFQSFTFTWNVGLTLLRHRETMLMSLLMKPGAPSASPEP